MTIPPGKNRPIAIGRRLRTVKSIESRQAFAVRFEADASPRQAIGCGRTVSKDQSIVMDSFRLKAD
jgi:hypothetical protein